MATATSQHDPLPSSTTIPLSQNNDSQSSILSSSAAAADANSTTATILPTTNYSAIEVSNDLYPDPLIPQNHEYLCCCGCFQIYCGTTTIAIFHYLCICLCLIFELSSGGKYGFTLLSPIVIVFHTLFYIFIVILFIGLEEKSSTLLLPYVIFGYIIVICYIFAWIFLTTIILLAEPSYIRRIIGKHDFAISTIKMILFAKSTIIFLGLALIQTWLNSVVQGCRKYFDKLKAASTDDDTDGSFDEDE